MQAADVEVMSNAGIKYYCAQGDNCKEAEALTVDVLYESWVPGKNMAEEQQTIKVDLL